MHWTIRHHGSPEVIEAVSESQLVDGVREGDWDPSDEVADGAQPSGRRWIALERHPRFAALIDELETVGPAPRVEDAEEQRIDMNPLIDVCLVLLVFFILATTLQVLERVLDVPTNRAAGANRENPITLVDARAKMILVQLRNEAGRAKFVVEDDAVAVTALESTLSRIVKQTHKSELLLDAEGVQWGSVVAVIDAAAGAKIKKVHFKAK